MFAAIHVRCSSHQCQGTGWSKHCRDTVAIPGESPFPDGITGGSVPETARESARKKLPYLCPGAQQGKCHLSVAADPELDAVVDKLYHHFLGSRAALQADALIECAVRSPDGLPDHARAALAEVPGGIETLADVMARTQALTRLVSVATLN